ncbi:PEP-CTERM sorting domain-containing protein [Massilia sp. METH4]|uniref:PEP-CTERM sorting domain-containing protein n=1 Tax=Massilia sp. METH4 TaxID=3123041 RepID=UPI0030CF4E10
MKMLVKTLAAAAATLAFAVNAHAAIGSASAADVTLAGEPADAFAYEQGWNPQSGPNGDTSGFESDFASYGVGDWQLLDKYEAGGSFGNAGQLAFTFSGDAGSDGSWTVTNTTGTALTLDLVFAVHAGNQGGAWLFDDQTIGAGQTLEGDWEILWTVGQNGNNNPDFSNLTLFARDVSPIPEPGTYAMLLGGLAVTGFALRRKRKNAR